jgi:hypothetical protein
VAWDDDEPVESYTPSPERAEKARADKERMMHLAAIVGGLIAIAGLVAAVAIGLSG